jgi:hypothetical protein
VSDDAGFYSSINLNKSKELQGEEGCISSAGCQLNNRERREQKMSNKKAKVIDVHNHLYPKEWLDFLAKKGKIGPLTIKRIGPTSVLFYYGGTRLGTVNRPGHCDPEPRIKDLDEYGLMSRW